MEDRINNLEKIVSRLLNKSDREVSSNVFFIILLIFFITLVIISILFGTFAVVLNGRYHAMYENTDQRLGFLEDEDILQNKIKTETYDSVIKKGGN